MGHQECMPLGDSSGNHCAGPCGQGPPAFPAHLLLWPQDTSIKALSCKGGCRARTGSMAYTPRKMAKELATEESRKLSLPVRSSSKETAWERFRCSGLALLTLGDVTRRT